MATKATDEKAETKAEEATKATTDPPSDPPPKADDEGAKEPKKKAKELPPWRLPAANALPAKLAAPLAILSGVFYWAAFPGTDVWPLAFICWAPLLVALRGQTSRRAIWLGLLQGLTCNVLGFYWLLTMLQTFSGFGAPLCAVFMVILCAYQGGRMAFMAWLHARAERRGWPAGLAFVCAFVASELVYPLLFPWYTGAQTHKVPLLMQLAEIGGPIAIGVALAGGSFLVAELAWALWLDKRPVKRARLAIAAAGPIVLVVWGAIRLPMVQKAMASAPVAKVGLVQPNLPLIGKSDSPAIHNIETRKLEATEHPDLVLWSEGAIPILVRQEYASEMLRRNALLGIHTPTIAGILVDRTPPGAKRRVIYNSAVLIDSDGKLTGVYDKTYLLAFGEYIPLGDVFPGLYEISKNSSAFTPGTSLESIPFGEHRITALICYEDILPTFTNAAVRRGDPDLLVNMTNDTWFGKSTEPAIHLALAKFRAVEHRRYLIRATNSGVSAFVDPTGKSYGETEIFKEVAEANEIRWMRQKTIYEVLGDSPWWVLTIAAALMAVLRRENGKFKLAIRA